MVLKSASEKGRSLYRFRQKDFPAQGLQGFFRLLGPFLLFKKAEYSGPSACHTGAQRAAAEELPLQFLHLGTFSGWKDLLKNIEHPPGHSAQIPLLQRLQHACGIRAAASPLVIQLGKQFRGGDGKTRLRQHHIALWKGWKRSNDLSPTLSQGSPSQHTVWNIGTHSLPNLRQFLQGQTQSAQFIESTENGNGI